MVKRKGKSESSTKEAVMVLTVFDYFNIMGHVGHRVKNKVFQR